MTDLQVKAFISLNDAQKRIFIQKAKQAGANAEAIEALEWLAVMSSSKFEQAAFRMLVDELATA